MHGGSWSVRDSWSGAPTCTTGVTSRGVRWRKTSVDRATEPGARREPRGDTDDEDDRYEHKGAGPGLLMPGVVGTDGVGENLERQRGDRLTQARRPELVAEGGEQERGGFTGDSRDSDQRAGGDARECCPKYYGYRSSPSWIAKRECGFPERSRNDAEHLLGRACHQRDHHRAECHGAGQRGEMSDRADEKPPCEDADHYRWKSV